MNKQKINKKYIPNKYILDIKRKYFEGQEIKNIGIEYGINYDFLKKYLKGGATSRYTKDGIDYKRCSICNTRRTLDNYTTNGGKHLDKNGNKYLSSKCSYCRRLIQRNSYILNSRDGKLNFSEKNKKTRDKHGWKYHTRRKVLKIIGVLDKSRRLKKQFRF